MDNKIKNDFFFGKIDGKSIGDKQKKDKKEILEDVNYDLITEDIEEINKANTKFSVSNYFKDKNMATNHFVSELIITKNEIPKCEHLFIDKNKIKDEIDTRVSIEDEGHFIGKRPVIKYQFVKDMINENEYFWNCLSDDDILTGKKIFNPMESVDKGCEIPLRNVKPLLYNQYLQKGLSSNLSKVKQTTSVENNVLEIYIDSIKLNHHSLFSIEHVLENYLIKACKLNKNNSAEIEQTETLLESLHKKKKSIRLKALEIYNDNEKKIFKNEDYQKVIKTIKSTRKLKFQQSSKGKEFEALILGLWKSIKYVRKKDGYSNTGVHLEIRKKNIDKDEDEQNWENNFERDLIDIIDEIKYEYFEKRIKYNEQLMTMKKSQKPLKEKLVKPVLDYDEDDLRNKLHKDMVNTLRKPGDPLILFEMKHLPITVTPSVTSVPEMKRRNDFKKLKYLIKILINNKDVCKSKPLTLDTDHSVNFTEKYIIHLTEKLTEIKLILMEKYNPILSNVFEIIIPAPSAQTNSANFQYHIVRMDNAKGFNDSIVGNGKTLHDLLTKYYPEINMHGLDEYLHEKLSSECEIKIKTHFANDELEQNIQNDAETQDDLTFESVSNLLENTYDPNDPKNALLVMYLNNVSSKDVKNRGFHLDSNLYFNFQSDFSNITLDVVDKKFNNKMRDTKGSENQLKSEESNTDDIINQIDLQRRNSIKKLQTMNSFLFQYMQEDVDKNVTNIITNIKYPTLRSITVDFLNPKTPLYYQSTQTSSMQQSQSNTHKDYLLKMCIFKAFHLPSRLDNDGQSIYNSNEEGIIKMVSLRPFVQVSCQGQTKRTTTAVGSSPTWNEQISFPLRFNPASVLTFQLFDEVIENLLIDDRLEDSTVHYHYNIRWLASLKIPLLNIFSQTKVEGTFLMHCPLELLGYKHNMEEKHPTSRMSYDSLRKELPIKQREEIFISVYLEITPNYIDTPVSIDDRLNSNEVELTHQHLSTFRDNFRNQFPARQLQVLVTDSCGKSMCVTRYFQPITLPDFNECLKRLFFNGPPAEASVSSKSTTPRKKGMKATFEKEDIDPNTIQSILSTNLVDSRRQSKSIKETFEMKSLNESMIDDVEIPLTIKMHICTRYVAMIPTYKIQSLHNQFIVLSAHQTLRLTCGSMFDHTILLMGYFLQLGIKCWCIAGYGLPRGFSTYVLIREDIATNEINLKTEETNKQRFKIKDTWKYIIYDATSGIKFDTKDSFCPLQRVHFICNDQNIWANIQTEDRCNLIRFNLSSSSDWRPVFQKNSIVSCPGPLPTSVNPDTPLYDYEGKNNKQLRDMMEERIKLKVQKWRGHRKTIWNRNCSRILRDSINCWEKWCLNTTSLKPRNSSHLQQLQLSYQIYGFPLNLPYTTIGDIMSAVKGTQLHLNEHSEVEFALGVEVFSYPNLVYSVWIYFASMTKK